MLVIHQVMVGVFMGTHWELKIKKLHIVIFG